MTETKRHIATTRALSFFLSALSFEPPVEGGFEELEQLVLSLLRISDNSKAVIESSGIIFLAVCYLYLKPGSVKLN